MQYMGVLSVPTQANTNNLTMTPSHVQTRVQHFGMAAQGSEIRKWASKFVCKRSRKFMCGRHVVYNTPCQIVNIIPVVESPCVADMFSMSDSEHYSSKVNTHGITYRTITRGSLTYR